MLAQKEDIEMSEQVVFLGIGTNVRATVYVDQEHLFFNSHLKNRSLS
jgi:hypothetical protein